MRHMNRVAKLNKSKSHRKALLQHLANALFEHERIKTTGPRAMELRRVAERLITLAKRKDQHAMRLAFAFLRDKEVVSKLFTDIGDRFSAINGGYTRVLKIGNRKGDNAPMALIELTVRKEKEEKAKAEKEAKKETKAKKEAKEPKEKKEPKAKKEPKVKMKAKTETKEPKEKKPRKKKEEVAKEAEKK